MAQECTWVYLVRHGETFWNRDKRLQGHTDSLLTSLGSAQASAAAAWFAETNGAPGGAVGGGRPPPDLPFAAIYSSDLTRAVSTAAPIARTLGLPIVKDARLRETNLGAFEGYSWSEVGRVFPGRRDDDSVIPHGESVSQKHARVVSALLDLSARHAGEKIIIVTHGGVLSSLYQYVSKGKKEPTSAIGNGTVSILRMGQALDVTAPVLYGEANPAAGCDDAELTPGKSDSSITLDHGHTIYAWLLNSHIKAVVPPVPSLPGSRVLRESLLGPHGHNEELFEYFRPQPAAASPSVVFDIIPGCLSITTPPVGGDAIDTSAYTDVLLLQLRDAAPVPITGSATVLLSVPLPADESVDSVGSTIRSCLRACEAVLVKSSPRRILIVDSSGLNFVSGVAVACVMYRQGWHLLRSMMYVRGKCKHGGAIALPACIALAQLDDELFETTSLTPSHIHALHPASPSSLWSQAVETIDE